MRNNYPQKIALCGVFCGLAVVILNLGGIIPLATFCAPAFAGICTFPVAVEFGFRAGGMVYLVCGILSLLFCPDREAACIFVFLLGYYPLVKPWLDKISNRMLQWVMKILLCNMAIAGCYFVLMTFLGSPELHKELMQATKSSLVVLIFLSNISFIIYDKALVNIFRLYFIQFRPKIFSNRRR